MGGHAVKLIGWGTSDAGEDYWVYCLISMLLYIVTNDGVLIRFDFHIYFAAACKSVE